MFGDERDCRRIRRARTIMLVVVAILLSMASVSAFTARSVVDRVYTLTFSPDCERLAVRTGSGILLYDTADASRLATFDGAHEAAFSPDGSRLAVATNDTVAIASAATGDISTTFSPAPGYNQTLAFHPSKHLLAVLGERSKAIALWDLDGPEEVWRADHEDADFALAFVDDGRHIVSGGDGPTSGHYEIRVWNAADGMLVGSAEAPRRAFTRRADGLPADRVVVQLSDARPGQIWSLADPTQPALLAEPCPGDGARVAISNDGNRAVVYKFPEPRLTPPSSWTQHLAIMDVTTGDTIFRPDPIFGLRWGAGFSPNNETVSIASSSGELQIWDVATGRRVSSKSGFSPPRVARHWLPLTVLFGTWFAGWALLAWPRPRLGLADTVLTPVAVAAFGTLLIAVHTHEITDQPFFTTEALSRIVVVTLAGVVVFTIIAAVARAWRALAVGVFAFLCAFLPAAMLLLAYVAGA